MSTPVADLLRREGGRPSRPTRVVLAAAGLVAGASVAAALVAGQAQQRSPERIPVTTPTPDDPGAPTASTTPSPPGSAGPASPSTAPPYAGTPNPPAALVRTPQAASAPPTVRLPVARPAPPRQLGTPEDPDASAQAGPEVDPAGPTTHETFDRLIEVASSTRGPQVREQAPGGVASWTAPDLPSVEQPTSARIELAAPETKRATPNLTHRAGFNAGRQNQSQQRTPRAPSPTTRPSHLAQHAPEDFMPAGNLETRDSRDARADRATLVPAARRGEDR
jgi:hypothetical protein